MSITGALNNATSGLSVSARLADTISNNVANALTEGYGRRTTEVTSLSLGGYGSGARVTATTRAESQFLTATRRTADASVGATQVRSDAYDRMMAAMGEAGADNALSTLATGLETALMAATASPQSTAKLADAVSAASALADSLNRISEENVALRTEADAEIGRQVDAVNTALETIDDINRKIGVMEAQGLDTGALQDERSRQIDSISTIVPVTTVKRDNGAVAIYSQNGGALLDGKIFALSFTAAANVVTPNLTIGAGLSGLSQDQGAVAGPTAVAAGTGKGLFDGGSLGALFEIRDRIVPEFDAEIDRYATDLIDRFQSLAPAGSLDAGGAGLFVDAGSGVGVAGRIALNAAVDPDAGGEVWRLRDGLAAATVGTEGDGSTLQALADAMVASRTPTGFVSQSAANDSATMASEIASFFAGRSARSDEDLAYLTARQSTLVEEETNETGVDSDSELQALMLVEQAYAANAKVLSVIDDLMKLLLE